MKYWTKRTFNTATGRPVVKVMTRGHRAPRQVEQFEVTDGNWEAAEAAAQNWISNN